MMKTKISSLSRIAYFGFLLITNRVLNSAGFMISTYLERLFKARGIFQMAL